MIGKLPTTLKVDNIDYEIRTDYRDILVSCKHVWMTNFQTWKK